MQFCSCRYLYTYVHIHIRVLKRIQVHVHVCMCTIITCTKYTCTRTLTHTHTCTHTSISIHKHKHTHIPTQDGIIVVAYSVLWALTALLNLGFAATTGNVVLGITVVSYHCQVHVTKVHYKHITYMDMLYPLDLHIGFFWLINFTISPPTNLDVLWSC